MRRPSADLSDPSRNLEESVGSPSTTSLDPVVDLSSLPPKDEIQADEQPAGSGAMQYGPPPHLTARFYRPTQARRKDSAASSRRGSVSSTHSRSSHGFGLQEGPQSKYIAQHLRRASILEDRRARLADRAAHAEKVRLRAALAKAATRDNSASEERALAAAQARERNLAEIAAACAEEVKRAKAVAESTKEKREQELAKMRQQMEERLAEAEKRREELRNRTMYKSRTRGQSIVNTRKAVEVMPEVQELKEREPTLMNQDTAAAKIQTWWKVSHRMRAVSDFQGLGLSIDGVRETSFEKVVKLLEQEKVLLHTGKVLRICGLQEGAAGSADDMVAVRTFLSAFLILGHPAQVLSSKDGQAEGEREQVGENLALPMPRDDLANPRLQELVGKARDLLICFENILSRLTTSNNYTPPPAIAGSLAEAYATFYNAFIAWKARDSQALVELMLMQFVELDAIWQTVKGSTDPGVSDSYRESIRQNQTELMVRIKRLAGPEEGKKKVLEAVRKARKSKEQRKQSQDTKPREADLTLETAMGDLETGITRPKQQTIQSPTPPQSPARNQFTIKVQVPQSRILPDNRIVVHELALSRDYRVSADQYMEQQSEVLGPVFARMRATMHDEHQEEHFMLLLQVAKAIREKLQRLVPAGKPMHTFIGEILDTEVARQQFVNGSFSYEKFFSTMGQLLPKLCAPVRDDEVDDLVTNKLRQGNYVDRLEALVGFISVMLSDYANHLLNVAAPNLIRHAPEYEAKLFGAALEEGQHDLSAASKAWRSARSKVLAEVAKRDPEGINHPKSRPTPDRFYCQMLLDIFTQTSPLPMAEMPEMLRLDHGRAVKCGILTRRIITAGAVLLQCKNLLKRDIRAPWKNEANRIMLVLDRAEEAGQSSESVTDGIMAALESGRSMPAATRSQLRGLTGKIVSASRESAVRGAEGPQDPRDPVLRLLLTRLRTYILARLVAVSASEKVKATSTAGERLAGLGLAEFVDKVREMVDEMAKVGVVDRNSHATWWEAVAERVAAEDGDGASGSTSVTAGRA
jgi:hypothetical protein